MPIAEPANPARTEQGGRAAEQINQWHLLGIQPHIGLQVDGDVGNHRKASEHHQGRKQKGPAVIDVGQNAGDHGANGGPFWALHVSLHARQHPPSQRRQQQAKHRNRHKRHVPTRPSGDEQAGWHAHHGGQGKSRQNHRHGAPPALKRDQLGHHGLHQGREHAAKHPRGDARGH